MTSESQFALLGKRRFLPFFVTQLLGAFNDNIFKQSLILAILYKLAVSADRHMLVNLCALLFILPFFLFSALGGQFGEKFAKDALIRAIKLAEIVIMAVGATGFVLDNLVLMLLALFAMGTHSALFGPVKYSILPQALQEQELIGGNALVEMGTFLAILAGTIGAGIMMSAADYHAGAGAGLEHLPPVLADPASGAGAAAFGVALAGGQLVVLVSRRGVPDADSGLRQGVSARR
jgi:hypothetical protein